MTSVTHEHLQVVPLYCTVCLLQERIVIREPSPSGTSPRIPHSSRAEQFQQQVLSERARIVPPGGGLTAGGARRRPSVFLSVEGGATEPQTAPLLSQSHSMDELAELPPPGTYGSETSVWAQTSGAATASKTHKLICNRWLICCNEYAS